MVEKEEEKIIDVGNEDFIDSEEWKDNFLKQGKWLRLLFMVVFSFVYYASMTVLWIIVLLQFLFVLFTSKVNTSIANINSYVIEFFEDSLAFLLFQTEEKPFPFKNNSDEEIVIEPEEIEEEIERKA